MDLHTKLLSLSSLNIRMFIVLNLLGMYTLKPASASNVLRPRGVSLSMSSFYDPARPFTCFDGSGEISFGRINDDYCDCKDGSDEPGTAACINGIFHCNNNGHMGQDLSSSYVNDGVCDCCDTSDEYASNADCLDVCLVLGEVARIEARLRAEVELEGYNIRIKMAEEGARLKKEREAQISELLKEKERAQTEQAEKLALKDVAEAPEMDALEQYKSLEEELKTRKEKERKERDEKDARDAFEDLDADRDGVLTVEEVQSKETFDTNRDGVVSEDEAKFYLQQKDSVDLTTFLQTGWSLMKPAYTHRHSKRMFTPPHTAQQGEGEGEMPLHETEQVTEPSSSEDFGEKEYDTDFESQEEELEEEEEDVDDYAEEMEDAETNKMKEEAEEEEEEEEEEKIQYDPETQALVDIATAARDEFKRADDALRDLIKEIKSLEEGLEKDFGPNQEFRVFQAQCFEYTDREYTYKLCPFDSAVQIPKNGHGETRLGSWGNWAGGDRTPYSVMKYTGGQGCWNGPQRSAEVRLSCGVQNEVTAVSEPNRCEYLFLFTTPAICTQGGERQQQHQQQHQHQQQQHQQQHTEL